jgi:hypothetical protein
MAQQKPDLKKLEEKFEALFKEETEDSFNKWLADKQQAKQKILAALITILILVFVFAVALFPKIVLICILIAGFIGVCIAIYFEVLDKIK